MSEIGTLMARARALSNIRDADAWERAVEALLLELAESAMLKADYTRKTQALAEERLKAAGCAR